MNANRVFGCVALLAALGSTPALAGDHVTFGGQWWTLNAPEAKFQEYREVPRGGFLENFVLSQYAAKDAFELWGSNGLADDQRTFARWSRGIGFQVDGSWTQTPHRFGDATRSPYAELKPGVYTLSDSLQRANQRNPGGYINAMNDALGAVGYWPTAVRTDEARAHVRARPMNGLRIDVNGLDRHRSGYQPYGATLGFNTAVELPAAIDQRTLDGDVSASWQKDRYTAQASVGASLFDNRVEALVWDNPLKLTDSTTFGGKGQQAMAPDNHVVRGSLSFGARLPMQSLFTASFGISDGRQDSDFLPYTINTAIAQRSLDSLPARSLDGHLTRITQDWRLSGRPTPMVHGTLRFNSVKDDNKTPVLEFQGQSGYDQGWTVSPDENAPYGHTNNTFGVDLGLDVSDPVTVGFVYEYRTREHTHREVEKDNENVVGARVDWRVGDDGSLSGSYKHGTRKLDEFLSEDYLENGVAFEQAGLRRYDVANRDRDEAGVALSWMFTEKIDFDVNYTYLRNKYPDSKYGLTNTDENTVVVEAGLHPRKGLDLNAGYGFGLSNAAQASNMSTPRPGGVNLPTPDDSTNWGADIQDKNVYVFGGAEWWFVPKKLLFSADYTFSRAFSTYDLSGSGNETWTIVRNGTARDTVHAIPAAIDLPSVLYRHHDLRLQATYRMGSMDLALRYGFEEMDVIDFANENVPVVGITGTSATALYLGDSTLDYKAHRVALIATKRF